MGIGAYLLGHQLLSIYTTGRSGGLWAAAHGPGLCAVFLCGIMDVLAGSIRGLGYSILPMVVSLTGRALFRIVWIYTISNGSILNLAYIFRILFRGS